MRHASPSRCIPGSVISEGSGAGPVCWSARLTGAVGLPLRLGSWLTYRLRKQSASFSACATFALSMLYTRKDLSTLQHSCTRCSAHPC